jgi:hypothetical protein
MEPRTLKLPRVRSALSALFDVFFILLIMGGLAAGVVATFNPTANDAAARLYARKMGLTEQADCPGTLGNNFWFACAGEVRRLHPATEVAGSAKAAPGAGLYSLHPPK